MFKKIIRTFVGTSSKLPQNDSLSLQFGRYSDAHKSLDKYDAWTRSTSFFEHKNYLQAYLEFFNYLQDDDEANVDYQIRRDADSTTDFLVEFNIKQGSKMVRGFANQEEFVGEIKFIQLKDDLHIALGRRLIEMNFDLLYGGFSLDEDGIIWLRFTTNTIDSFAGKLYNGLREIATRSDEQDDLLLSEFADHIIAIDDKHIILLSDEIKATKLKYLKKWIQECLSLIQTLDAERYASAISYILLTLIYRIDYLLTPEGTITAQLEDIHQVLYHDQNRLPIEKNNYAIKSFKEILEEDEKALLPNFYETRATFGITKAIYQEELSTFITQQLQAADWFDKNNQEFVLPFIFEYIVGYSLFNHGLPRPVKALFHLYMQVTHFDYFSELGFQTDFCTDKGLNKAKIHIQVDNILNEWVQMYPQLKNKTAKLSYKNHTTFSFYFFDYVKDLDYTTV